MRPFFLPAVLSVFALCLSMCWPAQADDKTATKPAANDMWSNWGEKTVVMLADFWETKPSKHVQWFGMWDKDAKGNTKGCCSLAVLYQDDKPVIWVRTTKAGPDENGEYYTLPELLSALKKAKPLPKAAAPVKPDKTSSADVQSPFQLVGWGRGGCSSCQAGNCQAEAPVQYVEPAIGVCLAQRVDGQPLRNVGRVVVTAPRRTVAWFQERKPVRRSVTAPFWWLKGCGG